MVDRRNCTTPFKKKNVLFIVLRMTAAFYVKLNTISSVYNIRSETRLISLRRHNCRRISSNIFRNKQFISRNDQPNEVFKRFPIWGEWRRNNIINVLSVSRRIISRLKVPQCRRYWPSKLYYCYATENSFRSPENSVILADILYLYGRRARRGRTVRGFRCPDRIFRRSTKLI